MIRVMKASEAPSSPWDILKELCTGGDVTGGWLELRGFPLLGGLAPGPTRGESKSIPFTCQSGSGLVSSSLQEGSSAARVGRGRGAFSVYPHSFKVNNALTAFGFTSWGCQ